MRSSFFARNDNPLDHSGRTPVVSSKHVFACRPALAIVLPTHDVKVKTSTCVVASRSRGRRPRLTAHDAFAIGAHAEPSPKPPLPTRRSHTASMIPCRSFPDDTSDRSLVPRRQRCQSAVHHLRKEPAHVASSCFAFDVFERRPADYGPANAASQHHSDHGCAVAKIRTCATLRTEGCDDSAVTIPANTIRADTTLDMSLTAIRPLPTHFRAQVACVDAPCTCPAHGSALAPAAILIRGPARRITRASHAARSTR